MTDSSYLCSKILPPKLGGDRGLNRRRLYYKLLNGLISACSDPHPPNLGGLCMDEQLKQIGERLRGLRDVLDIPVSEMAETIGISADKYEKIEQGEMDITISNLMKIARKYGVSTEELIFAEAPHMKSYYVTRKGQGMSIERTKAYKYQSLVGGFVNHKADVFIVTVEPKPGARTIYKNTHPGQEFNMVLEGKMELYIGGKTIILEEGDSIYFDSTKPHGMLAVGEKAVKFLAFTVE